MTEGDKEQVSFDDKGRLSKHNGCQITGNPGNHHLCLGLGGPALASPQEVRGAHEHVYLKPTYPFQSKFWALRPLIFSKQMAQHLLPGPS